jgi:hypothetical protein
VRNRRERKQLRRLGSWDGDKWNFHEPFTIPGTTTTARVIDLSGQELPRGMSRDEIVLALVNTRSAPLDVVDRHKKGLDPDKDYYVTDWIGTRPKRWRIRLQSVRRSRSGT